MSTIIFKGTRTKCGTKIEYSFWDMYSAYFMQMGLSDDWCVSSACTGVLRNVIKTIRLRK